MKGREGEMEGEMGGGVKGRQGNGKEKEWTRPSLGGNGVLNRHEGRRYGTQVDCG